VTPVELAQAQLDRYNAHDLEGFLALYANDVAVFDYPATPIMQGKAAMRERYARILFDGSPVHAVVTQRIAHGQVVIDHESVSNHPLSGDSSVVVIYEVRDGLIATVRFLR
jgi:hypothetical protein